MCGSPIPFRDFKISILTVPSPSEQSSLCSEVFLYPGQKRRHPPASLLLLSSWAPLCWALSWYVAPQAVFSAVGIPLTGSVDARPTQRRGGAKAPPLLCVFGGTFRSDLHLQQRGAVGLAVLIRSQAAQHAATQRLLHDEVQCADPRDLISGHLPLAHVGEPR